jgi:DNA-binding response OmpR family regulator
MSAPVRVLLVEDDRFLRKACEASLKQRGYDVLVASDGEEGLRLAVAEQPAIVLLDLLMPKMPGIEVLRGIRSHPATASIPVLILSNSSRDEDKRAAEALGASGYFVKANLSLKELAREVERLVQQAPPGQMP